jgi:hypothetical protein
VAIEVFCRLTVTTKSEQARTARMIRQLRRLGYPVEQMKSVGPEIPFSRVRKEGALSYRIAICQQPGGVTLAGFQHHRQLYLDFASGWRGVQSCGGKATRQNLELGSMNSTPTLIWSPEDLST